MSKAMDPAVFRSNYAQIKSDPGALWEKIAGVQGEVYNWPTSTYIAEPPFFERSEEHTSELQSLMRISYAVFCLKKKKTTHTHKTTTLSPYTHEHAIQ